MDTKYISVDETAELLNLSDRRVRQLIIDGEITALKDKNKWRIDIEELVNSELFLRKGENGHYKKSSLRVMLAHRKNVGGSTPHPFTNERLSELLAC